jgi:hypothetical protein
MGKFAKVMFMSPQFNLPWRKILTRFSWNNNIEPWEVPSAYFICDSFLYLDLLLKKRLFKPTPPSTRSDMAGKEAVRAKKLMGALRYLWRSSPHGSHDARLAEMKGFLEASPRKPPVFWLQRALQLNCQSQNIEKEFWPNRLRSTNFVPGCTSSWEPCRQCCWRRAPVASNVAGLTRCSTIESLLSRAHKMFNYRILT